jgi:magnesium-transporting ATPase (P-type)
MRWDVQMRRDPDDAATAMAVKTSNLNVDLAAVFILTRVSDPQIDYVFCDKTGTMTQNEMSFVACAVGQKLLAPLVGELAAARDDADVRLFLRLLAVAHGAVTKQNGEGVKSSPQGGGGLTTQRSFSLKARTRWRFWRARPRTGACF